MSIVNKMLNLIGFETADELDDELLEGNDFSASTAFEADETETLDSGKRGLYEPIHGSAPDIAGQNKANPIATILSAAMMLLYAFDEVEASNAIVSAVDKVLEAGYRTADLAHGAPALTTVEMTDKIIEAL